MPKPFEIRAAAGDEPAELLIYGDIGESWWSESVTAKDVVTQLQQIDASEIIVRINSYGGSVPDGLAIYNALRSHKASIIVRIEGVAVSIASLIAMAGDTVEIAGNAMFMIHAPWTYAAGNAVDLRETADVLDKYSQAMSSSYARKSGKGVDEILQLLTDGADHWYTGAEAKNEGFADVVTEELLVAASGFNQSRFTAGARAIAARHVVSQSAPAANQPRQQEANMPTTQITAPAAPAAQQQNPDDIRAQALAADKQRRDGIRAAFQPFAERDGVTALMSACQDDAGITVDQANQKLLAHIAKGVEPIAAGGRIEVGETSQQKFAKGATSALLARARLVQDEGMNEYRSYSLLELARASLRMQGVDSARMDKMQIVAAAFTHTSGDFGSLLANIATKAMLKGYEEAEETFQKWTSVGTLPDFKAAKRVDLDMFPALEAVPEGGEYKYATVGDRGETVQLATFGKLFGITRQSIINDDLNAFTQVPRKMGRAAIRTVGNLVYAVLTGNPNMADGKALFHADHANLPTAAGISTAAVDAMRVAMMKQRDGSSNAVALNIPLKYLLVPVALGGVARQVANAEFEVGASSKNNTVPNYVRGLFEVIDDARLDVASAANWYGAASPAMNDTIEVSYLDGNQAPMLEQQNGWTVDGVEFKVRLDAGVKALDWRTLAKNAGTGA
jgi:ATP-dependent protease ClpP protease subunit